MPLQRVEQGYFAQIWWVLTKSQFFFSIFGQKTKILVNIQNPKSAEIVGERAPFTKTLDFFKV